MMMVLMLSDQTDAAWSHGGARQGKASKQALVVVTVTDGVNICTDDPTDRRPIDDDITPKVVECKSGS